MIHLPLYLEKRLEKIFPKASDRNSFAKEVILHALTEMEEQEQEQLTINSQMQAGGTVHLFTDGGSRGNPGEAGIGCIVIDPITNKVIAEHKEAIGIETNNIAEYRALIKGLELVQSLHPNKVICHLDSELVVKQVTGQYRVKMPHLQPLLAAVQQQAAVLKHVEFMYIPRAQNRQADALVNLALDALR